jgi:hypothetical protein
MTKKLQTRKNFFFQVKTSFRNNEKRDKKSDDVTKKLFFSQKKQMLILRDEFVLLDPQLGRRYGKIKLLGI